METNMNKHIKRASWQHNIETYTGNNQKTDWFLVAGCLILLALGLGALSALV